MSGGPVNTQQSDTQHEAAYRHAVKMQTMAAVPTHSVFVSANAGSGKTRVLVDRVSRILLSGTAPDKIICLTYTKAAASEMQSRLFETLGAWSILPADALQAALETLGHPVKDADDLARARGLFARALETPGGLKVQTIHAFCERLLRAFPIEAGLPPGAEAIDERDAKAMHEQVIASIQRQAIANPGGVFALAIEKLAAQKNDSDLDALFSWMMYNCYKIDSWQAAGGPGNLAKAMAIAQDLTPEKAMAEAWEAAPKADIKIAADEMCGGGKTDAVKAGYIYAALEAQNPQQSYRAYVQMFFTQNLTPLKSMVTGQAGAAALELFGTKKTGMGPEAARMVEARDRVCRAHVLEMTRALYDLAIAACARYRALKASRRVMDFDDQIHLAKALLTDSAARDWVRYKLDGGIDHILVDEAQDTAPVQWDIINALSEEFFQPAPDRDPRRPRTLFAVGDEKQSIYGFQGARPEAFLEELQRLINIKPDTPDVKMRMSFRSAADILAVVDQVFYKDKGILETFDSAEDPAASDISGHSAFRKDAGYIEFWPAAPTPEKPEDEQAWRPVPVDTPAQLDARERLADEVAGQIKTWLDQGEPVYDRALKRTRPMQPKDIMILVQKRLPFFGAVIRNLKLKGVPVAGADRLMLTDSIAVQDLLSLAKFTLLSHDDLSLAEVLKSPLIGWDDDQLFAIAHTRKGKSLWQALPDGPEKRTLKTLRKFAAEYAPYEFFARTLAFVPETGKAGETANDDSLMQNIYTRLGIEAADALDAFLARALAHQRQGAPSLTGFIAEIESDTQDIKRPMDMAQNEVQVMTVHAAKGLEAPVVILPDTTAAISASKDPVLAMEDKGKTSGFVYSVKSDDRPTFIDALIEREKQAQSREAMRLLYVALTRAESRLLVCGFESRGKVPENSWHDRIGRALSGLSGQEIDTPFGKGLSYGSLPIAADDTASAPAQDTALPGWIKTPLARQNAPAQSALSPSQLFSPDEDQSAGNVPVRSPLNAAVETQGLGRFGRGNLIHKLLQILPDLPKARRQNAAFAFLESAGLSGALADSIYAEVASVLEAPAFAKYFAPGSMAEVSLVGRAHALARAPLFSGQIDRLCVTDSHVYIIDYKSNRPPPHTPDGIAPLYVRQMAAYRALARELYPQKTIVCALLWTDGPRLMEVPDAQMDAVDWDRVLST